MCSESLEHAGGERHWGGAGASALGLVRRQLLGGNLCCAPYLPMGGKHWNQEHTPLGQVSATSNSHAPYHFARVETAVLGRGVINRREALGMGSHPRTLAS